MSEETPPPSSGNSAAAEPVEARPVLQVINADATPEQIAAIVAVFATLGGNATAPRRQPRSLWATPQPRRTYANGLAGWRASGLPR